MPDAPTEPDLFDRIVGQVPPVLWHYTDAAGFMGIVTSGSLRFGNSQFLNDETERDYGWRLIDSVVDEQIAKGDHASVFFTLVRELTGPIQLSREAFVCSFSEHHESISQWQRYGADGHGYCIGFHVEELLRAPDFDHVFLRRLIYSPIEQRSAVNQVITQVRHELLGRRADEGKDTHTLAILARGIVMLNLSELALTFKNPHFADEAEWRLILVANASDDALRRRIKFSQRGTILKPHIDLSMARVSAPLSSVTDVVCGPKLDPGLAPASTNYFLRKSNMAQVSVASSQLRGTWR